MRTPQLPISYQPLVSEPTRRSRWKGKKRYIFCSVAIVLIVVFVLVIEYAPFIHHHHHPVPTGTACDVFCGGPILETVQSRQLFNDSKQFVDMPLKVDPDVALAKFAAAGLQYPNATNAQVMAFLSEYFDEAGSDLVPWTPSDYVATPPLLKRIVNGTLQQWAKDINALWPVLSRKVQHMLSCVFNLM